MAHDALTAKLIKRAGFPAYQVGGLALEGSLYGYPDADITHLAERSLAVDRIIEASDPAVMVDVDDGYGDAMTRRGRFEVYEAVEVDASFMEEHRPPKECGTCRASW